MEGLLGEFDPARLDAHCHLHRDPAFAAFAQANPDKHFFCMTETPQEYKEFAALGLPANAHLGVGLHPWQVAGEEEEARQQMAAVLQLLPRTWLVGEVGLDFGATHEATRVQQLAAFEAIAAACAQVGGKVLSIHAVQSAGEALAILQRTGCLDTCSCIFHWFSGAGDQLTAARAAGCYFSFGPRALATKRGRAYAAQVPPARLLRESDSYTL